MSTLFEPTQIGRYTIPNRIILAPVSRNRADKQGILPDYAAIYYAQRASAGLLIAESAAINDWANSMNAPGIFTRNQVDAWKKVTDAVHEKKGTIFLQFWHSGRAGHTSLNPSERGLAGPSAIGIKRDVFTYEGMQPASQPRAFTLEEIAELRRDYETAARNAMEAGFDGIEIQAANGYLIDQFLQDGANQRKDEYGGSLENRSRFLMEVLEDAIAIWGSDRVGVRLSPTGEFNDMSDSNPLETFTYVINKLNPLNLAYLHFVEALPWFPMTDEKIILNDALRAIWSGPLIANGGFDTNTGGAHVTNGKASAIAFGRPFIANPDLVERYRANAELNEVDEATIYGGDERGYTDYPMLS